MVDEQLLKMLGSLGADRLKELNDVSKELLKKYSNIFKSDYTIIEICYVVSLTMYMLSKQINVEGGLQIFHNMLDSLDNVAKNSTKESSETAEN